MKRSLLAILGAVCLAPLLFSDPAVFSPLAFDEIPGSYAIYRDDRGATPVYVGICFIAGNELALRRYDPSDKSEILLKQTFYTTDSRSGGRTLEPGTVSLLRGSLKSGDGASAFPGEVYAWMSIWLDTRGRFADSTQYEVPGEYISLFEYWVPVIQLRGIARAADFGGNGEASIPADGGTAGGSEVPGTGSAGAAVRLVTAGILSSGTDPAFYSFAGEPNPVDGPDVKITPREPIEIDLDGLSARVDGNWSKGQNGGYRLMGKDGQLAWLGSESLDLKDSGARGILDLIKLLVLYTPEVVIADSLRIFVHAEYPCLFYRSYDPSTGMVTARYRIFVPRNGSGLSIVTLGARDSVFAKNRAYLEGLLFGDIP